MKNSMNHQVYWLGSAGSAFSLSAHHIGGDESRTYDQHLPVVYMRRWILHTPFGDLRLHHILRSDHDRDLHDHPFDFWTFLLTGGYTEWLPADHPDVPVAKAEARSGLLFAAAVAPEHAGTFLDFVDFVDTAEVFPVRRRRWSLRYVQAETLHRLELDQPVWTLVWGWPKRRDWGFQVDGKWLDARTYLNREGTP